MGFKASAAPRGDEPTLSMGHGQWKTFAGTEVDAAGRTKLTLWVGLAVLGRLNAITARYYSPARRLLTCHGAYHLVALSILVLFQSRLAD